ncbi:MAG: hypothetical protein E3J72_01370 [Planctomycetota bacterium]|nr:MAG: hypothetical protein E3J72_01370 [Planctomycetota bacterium]
MKKLENILWTLIGAMVVVWLGLWAYFIVIEGGSTQEELIQDIKNIEGDGSKYRKGKIPKSYSRWSLKDFEKATEKKTLPTEKGNEILDEHRKYLSGQFKKCLDFFVDMDEPLEKWFKGRASIPAEEFDAEFKKEMDDLVKDLDAAKIIVAEKAEGRRSEATGLDYTSDDPSVMQKNFWIQAEIVRALIAPNAGDPPRIWKLHYIKCRQWGAKVSTRRASTEERIIQDPDEAKYFDLIKVSFAVELLFPDTPVLLQRLMSSSLHFYPHAFQIRKVDIGDERDTLVIPDTFTVERNGEKKEVPLNDPDFMALKIKSLKIFPETLPLAPRAVLDFGKFPLGKTENIPTQAEMRKGILTATLGEGKDYPFEEPPVLMEVFLWVRDLDYKRMQKVIAEKEKKGKKTGKKTEKKGG